MAKRSNFILLAVALILALLTTFVIMQNLSRVQNHPVLTNPTVASTGVVIVKQDVGPFQKISEADVTVKQVPTGAVQPGAATQVAQVVGQYTVTQWIPGQQVIAGMYRGAQQTSFAASIPQGLMAITIPDNPVVGVDHLIVPGNHVDLFMVSGQVTAGTSASSASSQGLIPNSLQAATGLSAVPGGIGNGQTRVTVTRMQNILVLYVEKVQGSADGGKGQSGAGDYITLAVTPAQAQTLVAAETSGPIYTGLRSSNSAKP